MVPPRRHSRQVALRVATVVALLATAGVASAQGGGSSATPAVHSVRSIVHILGIATAGALALYAVRARRQFTGGVFARSATLTAVGAVVFALAFAVMELQHQFGIAPFSVFGPQGQLAVRMGLFTTTVFAFGWGLYLVATTLQEWELT